MTHPALFLAISFMAVTLLFHSCAVYWQERKEGRSHEASLKEATAVTVFFSGTAAIHYLAVVSKYA